MKMYSAGQHVRMLYLDASAARDKLTFFGRVLWAYQINLQ